MGIESFMRNLNPENNSFVRAVLYVVGIGGFMHLTVLLIFAITKQQNGFFNPLFAIDFDRVFPTLINNPFTFFGGWVVFGLAIFVVYTLLSKDNKN
jgi:hypothetical protein